MPYYTVPLDEAQRRLPEFTFIQALTPSVQKAAFHVRNREGLDLCLKLVDPYSDLHYVGREIEALRKLDHPNVARLYHHYDAPPLDEGSPRQPIIIEHFIPGVDLSSRMPPHHAWSLEEASTFFANMLDGLSHLASHNLVHRDLKPSNIRIHRDGYPVIIDFGLARHLSLPDLTKTGESQRGNLAHFAPEQWKREKALIDPRTDLFAFGIILYNVVVGRHPFLIGFQRTDELEDIVLHSTEHLEAEGFKALPHPWRVLLGRLLERDLHRRPASPMEASTILRRIGGAA